MPVAVLYTTLLVAFGLYWPVVGPLLLSYGLTPSEATRATALGSFLGLVAPPILGLVADATGRRALLVRLLALGALVGFAGFLVADRARPLVYLSVGLYTACRVPLVAMIDATAVEEARRTGTTYGRIHGWASAGFVVAALAGGALRDAGGFSPVLVAGVVMLGATAALAWRLPPPPARPRDEVVGAWRRRLRAPETWLFLGAVVLSQIAAQAFEACFSMHVERLGYGGRFVGLAWGIGVGAEVILMAVSGTLIRLVGGADRMLLLSLGTAVVRWLALAHVTDPVALLVLQPLHGVTFGLFWVSGVLVAAERVIPAAPTAAQGLFSAASSLGAVAGMLVAGRLFEQHGGARMFLAAAVIALVATAAAGAFVVTSRRTAAAAPTS